MVHIISSQHITFDQIREILKKDSTLVLGDDAKKKIQTCRDFLDAKMDGSNTAYYGINTGFGALYDKSISESDLGLLQQNSQDYLQNKIATNDSDALTQNAIESLIQQRITARKEGRYSDADAIRKGLLDKGILLEDSSQGTTWRRQ